MRYFGMYDEAVEPISKVEPVSSVSNRQPSRRIRAYDDRRA
jgi:hypothetical protein